MGEIKHQIISYGLSLLTQITYNIPIYLAIKTRITSNGYFK